MGKNPASRRAQPPVAADIHFCNRNDKAYQRKLNALLQPIFFDFQFWYDLNLWDERYESYSIMAQGEIIANICVFKMDLLWNGQRHKALSVGAVATHPAHRGKGYARRLMEHIIARYPDTPMYLSADEDVTGFYPRFGFTRVYEKQPVAAYAVDHDITPQKLRFDDPRVWRYVQQRTNFSTQLDCLNSDSVQLFHIYLGPLRDCLYEIPACDSLVVARQEGVQLTLYGVFSLRDISFAELAAHLPFKGVSTLAFGFMPYWADLPFTLQAEGGDPFFVRGALSTLTDFKFPVMSLT